jgi:hypothetical protein
MFTFEKKLLASSEPKVKGKTYTQETKDRKGHTGSITSIAVTTKDPLDGEMLASMVADKDLREEILNR